MPGPAWVRCGAGAGPNGLGIRNQSRGVMRALGGLFDTCNGVYSFILGNYGPPGLCEAGADVIGAEG